MMHGSAPLQGCFRGFLLGLLLRPLLTKVLRGLLQRLRIMHFRAMGYMDGRSSAPRTVFRVSNKPWAAETACEEDFSQTSCSNCDQHEACAGYVRRLHAGYQHIYFARDGARCGGSDRPDRCCSATASALYALQRLRAASGVHAPEHVVQPAWPLLHVIRLIGDHSAVLLDARYLKLHALAGDYEPNDVASACLSSRHRSAGWYSCHWGERLQEVLLDRVAMGCCDACRVTSLKVVPAGSWRLVATADWVHAHLGESGYALLLPLLEAWAAHILQ